MRSHLFDPTAGHPRLSEAIELGREIYALYEAGADYGALLKQLGIVAGHPIHGFAITKVDELQSHYWLACLKANTGDDGISDLIFWPGAYFGDGDDTRIMSSSEILATALQSREFR
jgi:hypothetical protein